jgi:hypothetical protein
VEIVRQQFPKYPGHAEARRLWEAEVAKGAKGSHKKAFYDTAFELPMGVESYIQLGDAHAAPGVKPAALKATVNDAVRHLL